MHMVPWPVLSVVIHMHHVPSLKITTLTSPRAPQSSKHSAKPGGRKMLVCGNVVSDSILQLFQSFNNQLVGKFSTTSKLKPWQPQWPGRWQSSNVSSLPTPFPTSVGITSDWIHTSWESLWAPGRGLVRGAGLLSSVQPHQKTSKAELEFCFHMQTLQFTKTQGWMENEAKKITPPTHITAAIFLLVAALSISVFVLGTWDSHKPCEGWKEPRSDSAAKRFAICHVGIPPSISRHWGSWYLASHQRMQYKPWKYVEI